MAALHGKNRFPRRDEQKGSTFHHHTHSQRILIFTLQGGSTPRAPSCGQMLHGKWKQPRDKGQVPVSPAACPGAHQGGQGWMLWVMMIYQKTTSSISLPCTQPWGKQGRWKGIYSSGAEGEGRELPGTKEHPELNALTPLPSAKARAFSNPITSSCLAERQERKAAT